MASRVLHPLVCTKCGASLPAEQGQTVLVCPYCGQTHAFVPPPLEPGPGGARSAPNPKLASTIAFVGFAVVLSAGVAFSVLRSAATPSATSTTAVGATPALGPGDPKAVYSKGQDVDIHWGSSWWPGSVIEVDGAKYRAHYEGYGSGSDEWLTADRLRPREAVDAASDGQKDAALEADAGDPNATYAVGDAVDISWGSAWWPGSVKTKDGKRYRITYEGYSASWDEWVTATRLRPRASR